MLQLDEGEVARAMQVLPEVLAHEELVVQRTLPRLSSADALDTALKRSLILLRCDLDQDSFEYLRWKIAIARAEGRRLVAMAALTQDGALATPTQIRNPRTETRTSTRTFLSRAFKSEHDVMWTVSALNTLTPSDPRHATCLVFSSEDSVVCVWEYPKDWCDLSDVDLDQLRRRR